MNHVDERGAEYMKNLVFEKKTLTVDLDITSDNCLGFIPKEVELIQAITCHR